MKKLLSLTVIGSSLFLGSNSAIADWDYWGIFKNDPNLNDIGLEFFTVNSQTGETTLRSTLCLMDIVTNKCRVEIGENTYEDPETGELFFEDYQNQIRTYNLENDKWTTTGSPWWARRFSSSRNIYERLTVKRKSNGEIHIGDNSWITKEENGIQKVWAKDAAGNSIPIDYSNGTKLLINGRDVEQSINNVGALSAALTGLPTVPTDTTLACGLGTGTHGGDFAFSGGCASKVNEKLSINYAASITMPGQDYAGVFEDKFSARAGFVWQLGKSNKPNLISMKEKEKMEVKIDSLEDKNKKLEDTVSTLIAKLERLEKIALIESQTKDLATIKLP